MSGLGCRDREGQWPGAWSLLRALWVLVRHSIKEPLGPPQTPSPLDPVLRGPQRRGCQPPRGERVGGPWAAVWMGVLVSTSQTGKRRTHQVSSVALALGFSADEGSGAWSSCGLGRCGQRANRLAKYSCGASRKRVFQVCPTVNARQRTGSAEKASLPCGSSREGRRVAARLRRAQPQAPPQGGPRWGGGVGYALRFLVDVQRGEKPASMSSVPVAGQTMAEVGVDMGFPCSGIFCSPCRECCGLFVLVELSVPGVASSRKPSLSMLAWIAPS